MVGKTLGTLADSRQWHQTVLVVTAFYIVTYIQGGGRWGSQFHLRMFLMNQ